MSLQSLVFKMTHANFHRDLLRDAVVSYLEDKPLGLVEQEGSTLEAPHHRIEPIKPVPARVGLICGDCLQNIRSTLDYLITELVLANGGTPNTKHMFPIATTEEQWTREILNNNRLKGIHPEAKVLIEALQPFLRERPKITELFFIDELTNLNKHRRPILSGVKGTESPLKGNFPHIQACIRAARSFDGPIEDIDVKVWVAFGEEVVLNFEVTSTVEYLYNFVGNEVIPLFVKFLK